VTIQAWQNLRIAKENTIFSWRASLLALCSTILIFSLYEFMKQVNLINAIKTVSLYFRFTVQKGLANHISIICVNLDVESLLGEHNFTCISSGSFGPCLASYVLSTLSYIKNECILFIREEIYTSSFN